MLKVLVIGDTIIDHYVYGSVDRVNPEAPHSVVLDYMSESFSLGGATNVANNIAKLCPEAAVHFYGPTSDMISDMLTDEGIFSDDEVTHKDDEILLKTRFVSSNHHLLRVDRNKKYRLTSSKFEDRLFEKIAQNDYDLIVMSDYDKGTITSQMSKKIFAGDIPVLFDVKKRYNLPFRDPTNNENVILKANRHEFRQEVPVDVVFSVKAVVETRGHEGFCIHTNSGDAVKSKPLDEVGVVDVVGAGDTFLAGMAAKFLQSGNFDPLELAEFGNKCAAHKVKHFGTHAVRLRDLNG